MESPARNSIIALAQSSVKTFCTEHQAIPLTAEDIHQLRLLTKQLRALLQVYPKNDNEAVTRADHTLKTLAQNYAAARDIDVLIVTIHKLSDDVKPEQKKNIDELISKLSNEQECTKIENFLPQPHTILQEALNHWPETKTTLEVIQSGSQRVFKKACKTGRQALKTYNPEKLHQWRKWSKRWYYCATSLEPVKISHKKSEKLKKLNDLLGIHHDLTALEETLKKFDANKLLKPLVQELLNAALIHKNKCRKKFRHFYRAIYG